MIEYFLYKRKKLQHQKEAETKNEISNLKDALEGRNGEITSLSDKTSQLEIEKIQQLESSDYNTTELRDQLNQKSNDLKRARAEIAELKQDIETFKSDLAEKLKMIEDLNKKMTEKIEEIGDLKHQKLILEGILKNEKQEIIHSNDQLSFLHQEIQDYKQKLETSKNQMVQSIMREELIDSDKQELQVYFS